MSQKLDPLVIHWLVVAVLGRLKACRQGMLESMEGMLDVIWHQQLDFSDRVIPIKNKNQEFCAAGIHSDLVFIPECLEQVACCLF